MYTNPMLNIILIVIMAFTNYWRLWERNGNMAICIYMSTIRWYDVACKQSFVGPLGCMLTMIGGMIEIKILYLTYQTIMDRLIFFHIRSPIKNFQSTLPKIVGTHLGGPYMFCSDTTINFTHIYTAPSHYVVSLYTYTLCMHTNSLFLLRDNLCSYN